MNNDSAEYLLKLIELSKTQGYLLVDDIFDISETYDLSVSETDVLSEQLALRGILIFEEKPRTTKNNFTDKDYSRGGYADVYKELSSASPGLKQLVKKVKKIKPPQYGEIKSLTMQVKNGNAYARERLISCHLRLALKIALSFSKKHKYDLEDCVSAGFIGLITAADRFDPNGFSTFQGYASMWILQTIERECKPKWIEYYLPINYRDKTMQISEDYDDLVQEAYLSLEELVSLIAKKRHLPYEQVKKYVQFIDNQKAKHLNYKTTVYKIENGLIDDYRYEPEILGTLSVTMVLDYLFKSLTSREKDVIQLRYGLDKGSKRTLEEVGDLYGITRERARQIEVKALNKMRHALKIKYSDVLNFDKPIINNKKVNTRQNPREAKKKVAGNSNRELQVLNVMRDGKKTSNPKQAFQEWLTEHYCALPAVKRYVSELEEIEIIANTNNIDIDLFSGNGAEVFKAAKKLFEDKSFIEQDHKKYSFLSESLNKLLQFYGYKKLSYTTEISNIEESTSFDNHLDTSIDNEKYKAEAIKSKFVSWMRKNNYSDVYCERIITNVQRIENIVVRERLGAVPLFTENKDGACNTIKKLIQNKRFCMIAKDNVFYIRVVNLLLDFYEGY